MWDIITGIRGVDDDAGDAKRQEVNHLTNHRVRAVTGLIPLHPNKPKKRAESFNPDPLTTDEAAKRDKLLAGVPHHFREHYQKAAAGVRKLYGVDLDRTANGEKSNSKNDRPGKSKTAP